MAATAEVSSKMNLTEEEKAICNGSQGPTMQKVYQSIVAFGEAFGATKLVPIDHRPHLVTSFGVGVIEPYYDMLEELIEAGLKPESFTVDPSPLDMKHIPSNILEKLVFKIMYKKQDYLDKMLEKLGIIDSKSYTCTCYLPEVGNIPKKGDIITWSESSAVVFANSVLGARTNRNSAGIDILCNVARKTPYFDLLTDEGRKATWLIEVKTTKKPNAQVLGSAIGMKVVEDVPFVIGLDKWIGDELNSTTKAYLKDFGAATASNGAVGLYHIENLTPEAKELGRSLLKEDHQTYVIDDTELQRVIDSYPNIWKNPEETKPVKCFIGCPHNDIEQLNDWTNKIVKKLTELGQKKLKVDTIFTAAPKVIDEFKQNTAQYEKFKSTGAILSFICPLMYMNNPISKKRPVVTNSNKLRTYTTARFFLDDEILNIICTGSIPK